MFENKELSDSGLVKAGVPQISVLDPLFFLLYINDNTDNLDNLARLFADDTSLSYSGQHFYLMQIEINNDLEILDQWVKTWLVDFNPEKAKALIISNDTNIPELNIRINDESVELVDNHKHLGVTLASDANWTVHIENIPSSALRWYHTLQGDDSLKSVERFDHMIFVCRFQASR